MLTRQQRRVVLEESIRGLPIGTIVKKYPELEINSKEGLSFLTGLGIPPLRQSLAITYVVKMLMAELENNPDFTLEAAGQMIKERGYDITADFTGIKHQDRTESGFTMNKEYFGLKTLYTLAKDNTKIPEAARNLEDLGGVPYFAKTVLPPMQLEKEALVRRLAFLGEDLGTIAEEFNGNSEDIPGWLQFFLLKEFERESAAGALDAATLDSLMNQDAVLSKPARLKIDYFALMATMGWSPHAGQMQFMRDYFDPDKECRYCVLLAGRRFGKTVSCSVLAVCELFQPKAHVVVVAPNYRNADVIFRNIVALMVEKLNCKPTERSIREKWMIFENGAMLTVVSAENADSIRGAEPTLAIFEEACTIKDGKRIFEEVIRPGGSTALTDLGPGRGRVVFIGTPVYGAYLEEYYWAGMTMAGNADGWFSWSFPSEVNPIVKEAGDVEIARRTIGKPGGMTADAFAREYMAQWAAPEGLIYDEFSVETHIMGIEDYKARSKGCTVDYILGLDPGFTHPFAATLIAYIHEAKEFWVIGCYKQGGKPCSYHNDRIMEMLDDVDVSFSQVDFVFYDYASPQAIADLQAANSEWWASKAVKAKESGQNFIKELLSYQKIYLVEDTAYPLIQEFLAFTNRVTKSGKIEVNKVNDDALDALRYGAYSYALSILGDTKMFISADYGNDYSEESEDAYSFL